MIERLRNGCPIELQVGDEIRLDWTALRWRHGDEHLIDSKKWGRVHVQMLLGERNKRFLVLVPELRAYIAEDARLKLSGQSGLF